MFLSFLFNRFPFPLFKSFAFWVVILIFEFLWGQFTAEGGTRTHTPLQEADFKSAASTIPPPRHLFHCKLCRGRSQNQYPGFCPDFCSCLIYQAASPPTRRGQTSPLHLPTIVGAGLVPAQAGMVSGILCFDIVQDLNCEGKDSFTPQNASNSPLLR